jgi:hypothetical protein
MSNRFIRDPREAVNVGDIVKVKVISVDPETQRIGLSMKALLPPAPRRQKKLRPPKTGVRETVSPQPAEAGTLLASAEEGASGDGSAPRADPSVTRERPLRTRPRRRRSGRRREEESPPPSQEQVPEEKPAVPEPTLQEKIAILQSKFRGIN